MDKWTAFSWTVIHGDLIMDTSKNDWKLFRERLPGWQERYMANLLQEYSAIISQESAASDRF